MPFITFYIFYFMKKEEKEGEKIFFSRKLSFLTLHQLQLKSSAFLQSLNISGFLHNFCCCCCCCFFFVAFHFCNVFIVAAVTTLGAEAPFFCIICIFISFKCASSGVKICCNNKEKWLIVLNGARLFEWKLTISWN